ncbi:MAG: alpha/beta hydrolase [Alistipes sp.]|nr:alpha/beta hydrolase [Alistipes sp.]
MKRLLALVLALAFVATASAQKTISLEGADETVRLWDNTTAKHSNHETRDEAWRKGKKTSAVRTSTCELYIFKADTEKNTGAAVVMYPGGGYTTLNFSVATARWYASLGITAVLVKYRLPNYGHTEATIEDAMGAVRYIRTRTDLGIDPTKVGVSGSSAGGHLAAWVSNVMPDDEKPAFAILHFPWINLSKGVTPTEGRALFQFLGKNYCYQDALDLSLHTMVTSTTPPTLLMLCNDDDVVPSTNSTAYYKALSQHGVKASLHIYPKGGHSLKNYTKEYKSNIIDWLDWLKITNND